MRRFLLEGFIETPGASYRDTTFSFLVFERFKGANFPVANVFTFVLFCRINLKLLHVLTVENNIRPGEVSKDTGQPNTATSRLLKKNPITLTPSILSDIVKTAVQKAETSQLYAQSFKNEMEVFSIEELEEDTVEFAKLKSIFDGYSKNGNTEKFYAKYYAEVPLNSGKYFKGLSRNASTFLSTKAADYMLVYCKQLKTSKDTSPHLQTVLSDRETAGLQYLGGYVLHNLHKKHGTKKSPESQEAMSILKAGKLEETPGNRFQILVVEVFGISQSVHKKYSLE